MATWAKRTKANGKTEKGWRCDGGYHLHRTRAAALRCERRR